MRARLTLLLPRVGFGALLLACFAVPVVFTRQTAEAFMVPKVTVLWLCLIVAVLGIAVWSAAARRLPWPPMQVAWPLGAVVAWTGLATMFSLAPWHSLLGQYGRYDGFLGAVGGAVIVLAVVAYTWRSLDRLGAVLLAVVASAVVELGYVAIQQFGWDWIAWVNEGGEPIPQPYGLIGNSNFSGAHLALCMPLVLALAHRQEQQIRRYGLWALTAALGVGIWWTGTRGGLLAAVAGIAIGASLTPGLVPRVVRWGAVAATVAGIALVVGNSTGDTVASRNDGSGPRVLQSNTLADRQEIWATSLNIVGERPLVGVGPDALGLRFSDDRAAVSPIEAPLNADEAHNILIDRMATSGIPALAAYLWLLLVLGIAAWKARSRLPEEHRWLLGGFGGLLGGYLLQGSFSIDVVPLAMLGWVGVGALVALADPGVVAARGADAPEPATLRPVPVAAIAGMTAVALAAAVLAVRPMRADVAFRNGLEAASKGRPGAESLQSFERASDLLDLEPRYRSRIAEQLITMGLRETTDPDARLGLLEEANLAYQAALDRSPDDRWVLQGRARLLGVLADNDPEARADHLTEEVEIYRSLVERFPWDQSLNLQYGLALETRASDAQGKVRAERREAARRQFQTTADLVTWRVEPRLGLARIAADEGDFDEAARILDEALVVAPNDSAVQHAQEQLELQQAATD